MGDKNSLPASLTLATKVAPPGQVRPLESIDFMTLVGNLGNAYKIMDQTVQKSGNGVRFRETRDLLYQDLAAGKDIKDNR